MADIIVGGVFFVCMAFALKRVYNHFKSGSCSCGEETASSCASSASCGSCPHCSGNA